MLHKQLKLILNEFPKAYIYVVNIGGSIPGVEVIVDGEDTLFTSYNNIGFCCAEFCVSGGNHFVHIPEYYFWYDFTFNCNDSYYLMLMVGLEDNNIDNSFHIYPNPSSGKFYLETTKPGNDLIELQVMDLTGRIVYEKQPTIMLETIEIDLSEPAERNVFPAH